MDEKDYYFFYCIKESDDTLFFSKVIFKDVIKVTAKDKNQAREKAKNIMFNSHEDVNRSFRKSTGKYFYMVETDESQYIEIDNFECKLCGKKHDYKGIKSKYIQEGLCSFD